MTLIRQDVNEKLQFSEFFIYFHNNLEYKRFYDDGQSGNERKITKIEKILSSSCDEHQKFDYG